VGNSYPGVKMTIPEYQGAHFITGVAKDYEKFMIEY